jgi:hypothetical protein
MAALGIYFIVTGVATIQRRGDLAGHPWGPRGARYTEDAVYIIGVSTLIGGILITLDVLLPILLPGSISVLWLCGFGIMTIGGLGAYYLFGTPVADDDGGADQGDGGDQADQ